MLIVTHSDPSVHVSLTPWSVVRSVELPRTKSIAVRVRAIEAHYERLTGRRLDVRQAIEFLDRIQSERDDMPFPERFTPVAHRLIELGYETDAVHLIVSHLMRFGTAEGCIDLDERDREIVRRLMPRPEMPAVPRHGRAIVGDAEEMEQAKDADRF